MSPAYCLRIAIAVIIAVPAIPLQASGQLPPMPLGEQRFKSFSRCVAHLRTMEITDKEQASPPSEMKDGATIEQLVSSQGVKITNKKSARYYVEFGTQVRTLRPEVSAIETHYSYRRKAWECHGRKLTGLQEQGYMTPGFEPVSTPTPVLK